jgi:hypothetical protein
MIGAITVCGSTARWLQQLSIVSLDIFFLMAGCWYGVGLLLLANHCALRQVKEHGWHFMYSNGTGFLDLPSPMKL